MTIPRQLVVHTAAVDLDEAGAAFHKSARGQTLAGDVGAVGLVESVKLSNMLGFFGEIKRLWGCALHAVGEFEAFEPCVELG